MAISGPIVPGDVVRTSVAPTFDDGLAISVDEVRARDGDGLKLYDDGGNGIFVEDGGNVGIRTVGPEEMLHVSNGRVLTEQDGSNVLTVRSYSDNEIHRGFIRFQKREGTIASPGAGALDDADQLGQFEFQGFDGTDYETGALIKAIVNGTPASNDMPTELQFHTSSGSARLAQRMVIDKNGNVGIGTTGPNRKLHVVGTILVDGDEGGIASTVGLTDVTDLTANSTGVGTIKFKGATSRDSSGFLKIYIGTTAYYIPVFSAISG